MFTQYAGIGGAKGQFLGWWAVMTQAAFAYTGTEICSVGVFVFLFFFVFFVLVNELL